MPGDELRAFQEAFRIPELNIIESERWTLSVRPGQLKLGAMVLSSKRGVLNLADLDATDGSDFTAVLGNAETAVRELFGAVRLNVVCLMMKDPVVHYHVLPRYDQRVERYGRTWVDEDWPGPPTFGPASTPDEILFQVQDELLRVIA